MKHQPFLLAIPLLLIISVSGYAQSLKLKIANTEFKNMRYMDAIPHFEQILEKDPTNREVMIKLGECYQKLRDSKNSLRIFAMLATGENPSSNDLWHYAQALAANGYYAEAAEWYLKYEAIVPDDQYGRNYVNAYKNMSTFFKDSSDYYVQYVSSINSWAADFSPAYYRNGLIFISNREQEQVVRRVFEIDQSSFLSFFYASDTSTIQEDLSRPASRYVVDKRKDRHSDHTLGTSNDSNTPAHYGNTYLFDSVRHHDSNATKVTRIEEELQTKFHEGPTTSTIGQDTAYITRSTPYYKGEGEKRESRFAIFITREKDGKWSEAKEISINGKDYSSGHPALSPDNRKMYFASDRPGGKGGVDIWVVDYNHGSFGEPVNVEAVNTANNEMFPYVAPNGDLYFSTDGRPGLGGLDIFRAKIDNNEILSVNNIGFPFNSGNDDFGIIWNKSMASGFFSSNRKRGLADDDIYSFKKLCRNVVAMVYDSITRKPLDSAFVQTESFSGYTDRHGRLDVCIKPGDLTFKVGKAKYEARNFTSGKSLIEIPMRPLMFDIAGKITSKQDNSPIEGVRVILTDVDYRTTKELITAKDGTYKFPLGTSNNYTVTVAKNSCGTTSISKSTVGMKTSQSLTGNMEMLCKGDIIRIENIYYDLNKYTIRPDAAAELDKLVVLVNQYPDMRIELRSHTDSRASGPFNMKLSTNRAQAVLDYMATQGVLPSRMRASGYGESLPINKCTDGIKCSEEEYQLNRRTEFRVLSIN